MHTLQEEQEEVCWEQPEIIINYDFYRFEKEDFKSSSSWYNSIMVVRILWLKEHDLETWDQVNMLLHHVDNNKEEDKMATSIIYFIHNICNLTQFTEKDILDVIGNF